MIQEIYGENVPQAYIEALWKIRLCAVKEESRNGPVYTIQEPTMLTIKNPVQRVLFSKKRRANPFFHVMEFVWMMAGSNDADWISKFNKRMMEYADDGILRGAYGWRWVNPSSQIFDTVELLRSSPGTRQAVIAMWDPVYDGSRARTSDRPCNTHLYFRIIEGRLNLTVCNRSNDVVWGMLGSNVVHFTMLQELIARELGIPVGVYYVMSNNLHFYPEMPRGDEIMSDHTIRDPYMFDTDPFPLLEEGESMEDFIHDADMMVNHTMPSEMDFKTQWFYNIAIPMHDYYLTRDREILEFTMPPCDWRKAALEWDDRLLGL